MNRSMVDVAITTTTTSAFTPFFLGASLMFSTSALEPTPFQIENPKRFTFGSQVFQGDALLQYVNERYSVVDRGASTEIKNDFDPIIDFISLSHSLASTQKDLDGDFLSILNIVTEKIGKSEPSKPRFTNG